MYDSHLHNILLDFFHKDFIPPDRLIIYFSKTIFKILCRQ